ncbi:MAG: Rrf2 family transcriptional regulator [Myxococcota bacterium]
MRLTKFTDHGLRLLMYLASHEDEWVPVSRVAEAHGISVKHLQKSAHALAVEGYIEGRRGRQGGVRLAKTPQQIRVGEIIESLERGVPLVECFERSSNTCRIAPACVLKHTLLDAERAFYREANQTTLADLAAPAARQRKLLAIAS